MPDPTGRVSHLPDMHRGVSWKEPCRVATTASITISTALNAGDTIDGVTLATGDRVLVKDQTSGSENGIWIAGPTPARAFDMDQDLASDVPADEVRGAFVFVLEGSTNGGKLFYNTNTSAPTLDSTSLTFAQFAGSGAPTTADYLVGTAQAGLSAEIVVGTTPGGELGGTWSAPTVDATHSGSAHSDFIAKSLLTTQDDIIVRDATGPARLGKGSDGQVLTVDPTTHHLVWATPSGGGSALTVEEVDGSPTDAAITKIVFPNGTLAIASHVATYTPAAGGGGPSDYVSGASGSGQIIIPGLYGSPDIPPAGGSDDEFDATGLAAWTQFGSPDSADSHATRKSHAYLKKNAATGAHVAGIHKASPSTPFTMTAKLAAMGLYGNFNMAGIFVGVTNPASGAFKACMYQVGGGSVAQTNPGVLAWSNPTTYNGAGTYARDIVFLPMYLRIVAASSSNVSFLYSLDGQFFVTIVSGNNPGFTIGSVGLFVNPDSSTNPGEAAFDWVRFT